MKYINETIEDRALVLDGNEFDGCTLNRCRLIYEGGTPPFLRNSSFNECGFFFEGSAKRTFAFISVLYRNGGQDMIEKLFTAVRQGYGPEVRPTKESHAD